MGASLVARIGPHAGISAYVVVFLMIFVMFNGRGMFMAVTGVSITPRKASRQDSRHGRQQQSEGDSATEASASGLLVRRTHVAQLSLRARRCPAVNSVPSADHLLMCQRTSPQRHRIALHTRPRRALHLPTPRTL